MPSGPDRPRGLTMATRTLLLFRHADSVRPPGTPDPDRDLSSRGEDQSREAGRWLADQGLVPDLALVSPSVRTSRTWALATETLVARTGGAAPASAVEPAIYRAGEDEIVGVVREVPDDVRTVVLCGHEPGLSEAALWLAGDGSDTEAHARVVRGLKKGAVAVLTVDDADASAWSWRGVGPGHLTLTRVWSPQV